MSIKNKTRKIILADGVIEAKTMLQKSWGLLLYNTARPMLFRTRFGLHTFFMRYPIDVIVLDSKHHVVDMKIDMHPWSIFVWNPKYDVVLELPKGTIEGTKTKIGDVCGII